MRFSSSPAAGSGRSAFHAAGVDVPVPAFDPADEWCRLIGHVKQTEAVYSQFRGERHYVLGNHVWTLTRKSSSTIAA